MLINEFNKLIKIMKKLRSKNGCPWDKKQTFSTLKEYLIEETYEVIDAVNKKDYDKLKEELGDLLLQVVFYSEIAAERKKFTIKDVIRILNSKLIRRHPHVFGSKKFRNLNQLLATWEHIKYTEQKKGTRYMDGIPETLPVLLKAKKVQSKAERAGFEWRNKKGAIDKFNEEVNEFLGALKTNNKRKIKEEIGDLLFALVKIGKFYHINPDEALNKTIKKFIKRFNYIEDKLKEQGKNMSSVSLNELEKYWDEIKATERRKK